MASAKRIHPTEYKIGPREKTMGVGFGLPVSRNSFPRFRSSIMCRCPNTRKTIPAAVKSIDVHPVKAWKTSKIPKMIKMIRPRRNHRFPS